MSRRWLVIGMSFFFRGGRGFEKGMRNERLEFADLLL